MKHGMLGQEYKSGVVGIWYAVAAFTLWGFLPLYWKVLQKVPAGEILAHRILWSFVFCAVVLSLYGGWNSIKEALSKWPTRIGISLCGLLISANWFIYIWAVNANHIVEASLGYYINPLLSIFMGMLVLKERLNFWQLISLALAAIGVVYVTSQYGRIPWVALSLALTFTIYGLTKKLVKVNSLTGLTLETVVVAPVALLYILFIGSKGTDSFVLSPIYIPLLLIFSGVVTATPLLWFAKGAERIPLTTIGFIQYLAPSISLLLGIFVFKEDFTQVHAVTFSFIWIALLLFSVSKTKFMVELQPNRFKEKSISAR